MDAELANARDAIKGALLGHRLNGLAEKVDKATTANELYLIADIGCRAMLQGNWIKSVYDRLPGIRVLEGAQSVITKRADYTLG